jgi:hypothetical protein
MRFDLHDSRLDTRNFDDLPQGITHCFFVAVPLCAIEMSKSHLQRGPGRLLGFGQIRYERAEPDSGHRTSSGFS